MMYWFLLCRGHFDPLTSQAYLIGLKPSPPGTMFFVLT